MFDYLEKFNKLPKSLRDKVSSPRAMAEIEKLEKKYGIDLASLVMKVMIKVVDLKGLPGHFAQEHGLGKAEAEELAKDLETKVFSEVLDYLKSLPGGPGPGEVKPGASAVSPKKTKGADFFFSSEDEEEARQMGEKLGGFGEFYLSDNFIKNQLEEIIKKAKIDFSSQQLANRFKDIMSTYYRGVRTKVDTRQSLLKSVDQGGLGLENDAVDKILSIAAENLEKAAKGQEVAKPKKVKLPEDQELEEKEKAEEEKPMQESIKEEISQELEELEKIGLRDADYDFEELAAKKAKAGEEPEQPDKELDTSHELAPPPPALKLRRTSPPVAEKEEPKKEEMPAEDALPKVAPELPEEKIIKKEEIQAPKAEVEEEKAEEKVKFTRPVEATGRKKIEDVKAVPKVMSPIDELRYTDLASFRRLAKDPKGATSRIKEKIQLLEEEQYSKRNEGIRAWRQSPVNKLYLQIGQESISKNVPIGAIIEEREKSGEDFLTQEEFEAVMDLNKSLRF